MAKYLFVEGRGVPIADPLTGEATFYPEAEAVRLIKQEGWLPTDATTVEQQRQKREEAAAYDRPVAAGIAGALRAGTFGLSDVVGEAIWGDEFTQDMRKLQEHNPTASAVGEVGGAVASSFIPGSAIARMGKAGAAIGAGTKAALGGGKMAGAAGLLARGALEGGAFGMGSAVSELALSEKPLTAESVTDTIERHLVTGAGLGAGLTLGLGGVAAAGKWGLEKAGLGKSGRDQIARLAELTAERDAIQATKAEKLAELEKGVYPPAQRDMLEAQLSQVEDAIEKLHRPNSIAAGANERSTYRVAKDRLAALEDYETKLTEATSLKQQVAADMAATKVQLAELGSAKAPRAPKVSPELEQAQAEVNALRSSFKGEPPPPLEERWNNIVEATRERNPEAVVNALEKPARAAQITSLWRNAFRNAEDSVEAAGKWANANRYAAVRKMEEALGLGRWGEAGEKLAFAEAKLAGISSKTPQATTAGAENTMRDSMRQELLQRMEELKLRALKADETVKALQAAGPKGGPVTAGESDKLRAALARMEDESGQARSLSELRRAKSQQDELAARIKELKGETAEEAAIRTELEQLSGEMGKGKAGLAGRIAEATASRAMTWGGTKAIAQTLGGIGGGMRRGGMGDIIRTAAGYEISRAFTPRIIQGLKALVSPGTISSAAELGAGLSKPLVEAGKRAGKALRPAVMRSLSSEEFDAIRDELSVPDSTREMMTRAALQHQPEEIVNSVMATEARQRAFLSSKMPRDPRLAALPPGALLIPTGKPWKPSFDERQRFARYVRGARHWKNTIEDLVNQTATQESMEALRVVYPEVYGALKTYCINGVREAVAKGKTYGQGEARMLDLVIGPPYQTQANVAIFQSTFAPQERQQPTRGKGPAVTLSKGMMNQLQQAQAGLAR